MELNGEHLSIEDVCAVAAGGSHSQTVALAPAAVEKMERSRAVVERLAAGDAPVYGVNTGVGLLADVRIAPSDLDQLQRNVVRWHCAGVRAMNDPTGSRLSPWLPPTLLNPSSARHGTPRGGGWGDNMCDSGCV